MDDREDDDDRDDDPFDLAKRDVATAVAELTRQMQRWRALLLLLPSSTATGTATTTATTTTTTSEEFRTLLAAVEDGIKSVQWDLQPMEEAIARAATNPEQYHVTAAELAARREFLQSVFAKLQGFQEELRSPATRAKMERDQREQLLLTSKKQKGKTKSEKDDEQEEEDIELDEEEAMGSKSATARLLGQARQQDNADFFRENDPSKMIHKQDTLLDHVSHSVQNLKHLANSIASELTSQEELIERTDRHVGTTSGGLAAAQRRTNTLLRKMKNDRSCCCIVFLVVLVVILLLLYVLM